jgi:hypothetical protein
MDWVIPDEGKTKILDEVFRLSTTRESFVLDQWLTGGPVDDDSTGADFTLATYTGYAQIAIARSDWGAATDTAHIGNIIKTVNPVFTCTAGSPQTVAGLLLRGATSGIIYAGCNYSPTIAMAPTATDTINPLKVSDKTFV